MSAAILALAASALLLACRGEAAPAATASAARTAPPPAADFDHEHARWTRVLERHVHGDRFDYAALKADPAELEAYLDELHAVTPDQVAGWSREQRYAFWINAYNAHTIAKVVRSYPLDSIKDLSTAFGLQSVFDQEFIPMEAFHPDGDGDRLSLNDVEHGILRKEFRDARVHAAINCASISCPPLRDEAFVAARLDGQLDEQMRAFLADPRRNRFDPEGGEVRLSEIFKWFAEDFERDAGSVRAWVERWAPADRKAMVGDARIRYLDYDWGLNDVEHQR